MVDLLVAIFCGMLSATVCEMEDFPNIKTQSDGKQEAWYIVTY